MCVHVKFRSLCFMAYWISLFLSFFWPHVHTGNGAVRWPYYCRVTALKWGLHKKSGYIQIMHQYIQTILSPTRPEEEAWPSHYTHS